MPTAKGSTTSNGPKIALRATGFAHPKLQVSGLRLRSDLGYRAFQYAAKTPLLPECFERF